MPARTPPSILFALVAIEATAHAQPSAPMPAAPPPGQESGRVDVEDESDPIGIRIARGALFVPKLVLETAFLPLRGAVYADDELQLEARYYRLFYSGDHQGGVVPILAYETGLPITAGVRVFHRDIFGDGELASAQGLIGTGARVQAAVSARSGRRFGPWLELGIDADFDRRPEDPFYGIGNGNLGEAPPAAVDPRVDPTAVETHHRYQELHASASADVHAGALHAIPSFAMTRIDLGASSAGTSIDEVYDPAALVGFMRGVRHAYGELELRWDSRRAVSRWEHPQLYAAGSLAAVFAGRIAPLDDSAAFWHYGVELQHFIRLAPGPRTLALRFHGEGVTGSRDDVPFVELPALGGGSLLRGYTFDRFRDRVAAVGSVQYTWDLSHSVDAYLFVDAGRVYESLDALTAADLRVGYGLGFDIHTDGAFWLEGAIGSSKDGGLFVSASFSPVVDLRPRWR